MTLVAGNVFETRTHLFLAIMLFITMLLWMGEWGMIRNAMHKCARISKTFTATLILFDIPSNKQSRILQTYTGVFAMMPKTDELCIQQMRYFWFLTLFLVDLTHHTMLTCKFQKSSHGI